MEHYTDSFTQTGDTCGACTLMIALYEQGLYAAVGAEGELELFAGTQDRPLTAALGAENLISSPRKMIATADANHLKATLYMTESFTLPDPAAMEFRMGTSK
jgi:hypothetical protein